MVCEKCKQREATVFLTEIFCRVTGRTNSGHERAESTGQPNRCNLTIDYEHLFLKLGPTNELRVEFEKRMFTYANRGGTLNLPIAGRFEVPADKSGAVAQPGKKTKTAFDKWIAQF